MKRFFFYLLLLVSTVSFAQKNNINLIRGTTFYSTWTVTGDYTSYSSLIFKVNLGNNQYLQRAVTQSYVSPTTTLRCTLYVNDTQDLNPGDYLFNIYAFGADTLVLVSAYMKLTKNVALDPVPITFPRYTVIPIDTPNTANTFIVGQDSNNVWYQKTVSQVRSILGVDTTGGTSASLDSLYTKTSHIVNVMDYVATHDTTGNWQPAIQAAIDAVKSNSTTGLIAWHNMGNTMTQVVLPAKYMTITEPIKMYSAITLVGQGASSIPKGIGW